jgi:hypothetical protein
MIGSGVLAGRSDLFENFLSRNKHRLRPVPSRIQLQIQEIYFFVAVCPSRSGVRLRIRCFLPKDKDYSFLFCY